MPAPAVETVSKPTDVAICIDDDVYVRYRSVLQHLCVGLIDVIASVRLVSSTPRAESLSLGPIQPIVHQPLTWPLGGRRVRRVIESLATRPPTLIHAMSAGTFMLAEMLAEEFDADLVYQCHGLPDVEALAQREYSGPRQVIAASEPLLERIAELPAFSREDIHLVRLGVISATEPSCYSREGRAPTLVCASPLGSGQGLENLLRAISNLHHGGHAFLTFLLGTGPEEWKLRELARELGLSANVVFAAPDGDPARAMVGADVFVQPTAEAALSARALQALAQGIAVVAVAGGINDAYRSAGNAQVAASSAPTDLATAIERLLRDRAYARLLATGAIEYTRKNHTISGMAEGAAGVYRRLALQRATYRIER